MKRPESYLPLTEATYLILAALGQPCHGYAIMQRVGEAAGDAGKLGPGTLYGALTKLLDQRLIERAGESDSGGERRKLYRLTALGRQVVSVETARLQALAKMGARLLGDAGGVR